MTIPGCGGGGSSPIAAATVAPNAAPSIDFSVTGTAPLSARGAAKGIIYGAATNTTALSDERFAGAFAAECGLLVAENELKWNRTRPTVDTYNFAAADSLFAFAQSHNMLFRGHTLVWHEALPSWFGSTVNVENAERILRSHIATVVGRYAGKVHSWDVVNEAVNPPDHDPDGLRTSSRWYQLLGPAYIDIAFRAAAEADPHALLVYNDYGLDYDTPDGDARRAAVLQLLTGLKAAGTPVHALGIQAHLKSSETHFNSAKLRSFLSQVAALGLKIMVTELDVRDDDPSSDISTRDQRVAAVYREYLGTVLAEPAVIAVVSWGLSDAYTWYSTFYPRTDGSAARPLPLDAALNRKLAWNAVAQSLDAIPPR